MKYPEALKKLRSLEMFGVRPGLQRIRALLHRLDDPHKNLKVVHVAGTNGKGSVCAMLDSVLRQAGFRTGLFTSPHLVDLKERFQARGRLISNREFASIFSRIWPEVQAMAAGPLGSPTFFEVTTALGLVFFTRQKVDVVILETGLGGRFDSTNVFAAPLATIITNIDLEHTQVLGKTVEKIAWEKAGIAKPGVSLVTAAEGKAREVIEKEWKLVQRAGSRKSGRFTALQRGLNWEASTEGVMWGRSCGQKFHIRVGRQKLDGFLPLLGRHQQGNLACVLAAVDCLKREGFKVEKKALKAGLARTSWPGRLQVAGLAPRILLDGAHNPAGARALAGAILELARGRTGLVLGVLKDKDWQGILRALMGCAGRFFSAPRDRRALDSSRLLALARKAGVEARAYPSLSAAFHAARGWARPEDTIVVSGSLYTVGKY